jgi:hypothetical protein
MSSRMDLQFDPTFSNLSSYALITFLKNSKCGNKKKFKVLNRKEEYLKTKKYPEK